MTSRISLTSSERKTLLFNNLNTSPAQIDEKNKMIKTTDTKKKKKKHTHTHNA